MKTLMYVKEIKRNIMYSLIIVLLLTFSTTYSFCQQLKWALIDTPTTEAFHDGIACFYESGLYGGINRNGEKVIPAKFVHSFSFNGGFADVAIADNKRGIINIRGEFLLAPIYSYIAKANEANGLYVVSDEQGKKGVFYNNRLVVPVEWTQIGTSYFPFIEYGGIYLNILSGKIYNNVSSTENLFIAKNEEGKLYIFDKYGTEIGSPKYSISNKGITLFKDSISSKYGFKNAKTGEVITSPTYTTVSIPYFINDVMIIDKGDWNVLVDASGKELIKSDMHCYILHFNESFVLVTNSDFQYGLYSITGKEILPAKYDLIMNFGKDWILFKEGSISSYYHLKTGKIYRDYDFNEASEGMCKFEKNGKCGYINCETLKEIPAQYKYAYDFSEGLAYVKTEDERCYLIDKNGNIVLKDNEQISIDRSGCSEGVIGVRDNIERVDGYIYNPIGKTDFIYNQTSKISDAIIDRWLAEAHEKFEKENYSIAKEYYYKAMMYAPKSVNAIIGYGACLANMGYNEEALDTYQIALDLSPNNSVLLKNISIAKENIIAQKEKENSNENATNNNSLTFLDALISFTNAFTSAYGGNNNSMQNYNNSVGNGNYETPVSTSSSTDYQSQYNNWARIAERHYNSLTNLGMKVKNTKTGARGGSTLQSMGSGNYLSMKKSLREAQQEMRKIRSEARKTGVTIQQSSWETATVNY